MIHSTYDVNRILKWFDNEPADKPFTRDTVIQQLAPISFSLVDYVLSREVERGSLYKSGPTGNYYMRKESKMDNITYQLNRIEDQLAELLKRVEAMPDKKLRLWQRYDPSIMMPLIVDVMLANGEVLLDMPYRQVAWKNYPDDHINVIAWREAK